VAKLPKKLVRIRCLEPLLRQGRIKMLRTPGTSLLLEQMRAFPIHVNDDGPDALEMAIRLCEELLRGTAAAEPEPERWVA
jgi:phage terminase large subunit-like protein